jgi:MFS family permease
MTARQGTQEGAAAAGGPAEALATDIAGAAPPATQPGHEPLHRGRTGRILAVSCLAMALTAPGQTAGLAVFIDPLLGAVHVSRSALSATYLVATLIGAATLTPLGRALDRFGIRRATLAIVAILAAVLVGFSAVTTLAAAALAFTGLRMFGQGGLTLAGSHAVTLTFARRRGTAMGIASAALSSGVALSPVLLNLLVDGIGWRKTVLIEAAVIAVVLLPAVAWGYHDVDHAHAHTARHLTDTSHDWTLRQTLRSPMFWAMALAMAATAMLVTGLSFHQIDLLSSHGLSRTAAAANFLPQTLATLLVSLLTGWTLDRLPGRVVMSLSMAALAAALALATTAAPGGRAIAYAVALGAANGGLRAQEATLLPRYYGVTHLGAIRGAITTISVAASAFGPLIVALGQSAFASYNPLLLILITVPVTATVFLLLAPDPRVRPT